MDGPSADESLPPGPSDFPLTLSGALSLPLVGSDPRLTFSSLGRSGDTMESGSTKEYKKEERAPQDVGYVAAPDRPKQEVNTEDCGVFVAKEDNFRFALFPEDIQNAIDVPTTGWPSYQDLFGRGPPVPLFYEQSQNPGLGEVDPPTTQDRAAGRDIVSRALEQSGAKRAGPAQWLMMNEKGDMYNPMVALDYVEYRLPTRFVRERCNSNGPWECRLGPRARGPLSQRMVAPKYVPPATRKDPPREIIQILENPHANRAPRVHEHRRLPGALGYRLSILG